MFYSSAPCLILTSSKGGQNSAVAGLLNHRAQRREPEVSRPTGGSRPDGWRAWRGSAKGPGAHTWGRGPRAWPAQAPGGVACGPAGPGERRGRARACVSAAPGFAGACLEARPPGGGRGHGERASAGRRASGRRLGSQAAALGGDAGAGRPERAAGTKGRGAAAFGTPGPGAGVGRRAPPRGHLAPGRAAGSRSGQLGVGVCGSPRPAEGAHRLWAGCPGNPLGPRGAGEKMRLLTVPRRRQERSPSPGKARGVAPSQCLVSSTVHFHPTSEL